ncbi:ATP adenylyltransferase family protein [Thauera aromatica]|uniref:ATP adenylyltransferase family protein n=1 Tax=Thauera aromatica TaxID=59405 RepID=UPI001FFC798C|nr:DUF4922 domain-containing protein [Thauera aromatica]MCK2094388.1 DUF4922 domain-containing protein [Thauera aromatica]
MTSDALPAGAPLVPPVPAPEHACDLPADFLERADRTIARALESGALQPIRTEQASIECNGLPPFSVRWVSSLALKDRARVDTVTRRRPDFNPFLPPEAALTVAALGPDHLVVLNKFPVIERHLLIVTRRFEDQSTALSHADFRALAALIAAAGGLGFYNGGRIAGASQAHKHLQWIPPGTTNLAAFAPQAAARHGTAISNPALPWSHAFVALPGLAGNNGGEILQAAFAAACEALSMPAQADPMPAYNLLVNPQWLLVVPRTQEKWGNISVNSLGYAGSLFVRDIEQIETLRTAGPLAVLAAVGRPRRQTD